MLRRSTALALFALLEFASWAAAGMPPTRPRQLLLEATSAANLRSRLSAFIDSALAGDADDRLLAGEAAGHLAASLERGGRIDSAIVWFERARRWRGTNQEIVDEVDARLERRAPGDVATALGLLAPLRVQARVGPYALRLAWAQALAGHADSAAVLFEQAAQEGGHGVEWEYRVGRTYLEAGRPKDAFTTLFPLAVASRRRDADVMRLLRRAAETLGGAKALDGTIDREIAVADTADLHLLFEWGGRVVQVPAFDGFPLECQVFAPGAGTRAARRSAVIVVAGPDDGFAEYDSLVAQCQRSGLVFIRLDPRGSGRSRAPSCPSRDAWRGREEHFEGLVARDVRSVVRALGQRVALDTTRYVVGAVGASAPIAAIAATLDPAARAVLLVDPSPAPVAGGPLRATLVELDRPTFVQVSSESFEAADLVNAIVDSATPGRVRVADSGRPGRGAAIFQEGPIVGRRFTEWLKSEWARSRATPPTPRRRG